MINAMAYMTVRLFPLITIPLSLAGCTTSQGLFRERDFTCASFAKSVNYFVALGEERAIKELSNSASECSDNFSFVVKHGFSVHERIGWVCRVLYESKGAEPLRDPLYGGLALPYHSMGPEKWPLYPLVRSGITYFVLSEGYRCAGVSETPEHYIEYCRMAGVFRKNPILIPRKIEAEENATALRESNAWRDIKWKDSGRNWSYNYDENRTWQFVKRQASNIND